MVWKHGRFMLPRTFPNKVAIGIDFTDEAVYSVWYSSCENTFVVAGNLQLNKNKFWLIFMHSFSLKHTIFGVDYWKRTSLLTGIVCVPSQIVA